MRFDNDWISFRAGTQQIITGYHQMVNERLETGWDAYLLTLMFHDLRGPRGDVKKRMIAEARRAYAISLTRIVRNPHSQAAAGRLPVWLLCPDYPVPKRIKSRLNDVALNDGLHFGGIALVPPQSRLQMGLDDHFVNEKHRYIGSGSPLRRVVATRITVTPDKAVSYTFKSLERGRSSPDDIIIFPLSRSELS